MHRRTAAVSLVALALTCAAGAAGADAAGDVKYRQAIMSSQGAHLVAIIETVKGAVSHPGNLLVHAKAIEETTEMIPGAFKEQAMEGKTRATDKIWSDWSGFEEKAMDAHEAATSLVEAIETKGDVGAAVKSLGQACTGCHREYRKSAS